jgi:hypothetical protein
MSSVIKVDAIQNQSGTSAIAIDVGGRPVLSDACVAVQCSNSSSFGTSSNSTYVGNYKMPLPTFTSATRTVQVNRGGMILTFPSYAGGNYAKIVVPVTGVYEYRFYGGCRNYNTSDWWTHGLEVNSESASGTGSLTHNLWNFQMNNSSDQNDDEFVPTEHSCVIALNANDYVVPFVQSVQRIDYSNTNMRHGFIFRQIG